MLGDFRCDFLDRHAERLSGLLSGCHLRFFCSFRDRDGEDLFLAITDDLDLDRLADAESCDQQQQLMRVLDRLAVDLGHNIPRFEPCLVGGIPFEDIRNQGAALVFDLHALGDILTDVLNGNPQPSPGHLPLGLQVRQDGFRHADRDGEPNSLPLRNDRRVDADHLALHVEERSPAVSRVDGGVGLDEIVIRPRADHAALCADDPGGDGLLQAEGVPDGQNPVSHPELLRVARFRDRQAVVRFDLDQGDVGLGVLADDFCLVFLAVGELHQDFIGLLHDVVVCEDIAVMADDEPGAEAFLFELTLGHVSEKPLKEIIPAEITIERRSLTEGGAESAAPHRLGRADVYDGGFELFGQIRKGEGRARDITG